MEPTNKIVVAAYSRWRHVFYRTILISPDKHGHIDMAAMRRIMDAYRRIDKAILAMACQCEAESLARHSRGCGNEDLDNVETWYCQQLMAVAGAAQLPKDWNPAVPEFQARQLGL